MSDAENLIGVLVGGPVDGKRVYVYPGQDTIRVPQVSDAPVVLESYGPEQSDRYPLVLYVRRRHWAPTAVFAPDDWSDAAVMQALAEGYLQTKRTTHE